jgi:hypothetical protein
MAQHADEHVPRRIHPLEFHGYRAQKKERARKLAIAYCGCEGLDVRVLVVTLPVNLLKQYSGLLELAGDGLLQFVLVKAQRRSSESEIVFGSLADPRKF